MRSIKFALRTLLKTPFVTAVAVLSLALGIGANAAIFSLFQQILMRPLPVRAPDELVNLGNPGPKPGSQTCNQAGSCDVVFSYAMYRDLEKEQDAFAGIAAHRLFSANVAYQGQTLNGEGMLVSGSYFPLLGLNPLRGRLLTPDDDQRIGDHPVAVLSYRYWASRLGSDPSVIGKSIVVNGTALTIVGVAPEKFDGTTLGAQPFVFVPLTMRGVLLSGWDEFANRRNYWAYLFARTKPGTTAERAETAINALYSRIVNNVEAPLQDGMSEATMAQFRAKRITMEDGRRGQSSVHEEASMPLILLFATAGIVLLIACANIANLLLARGANRAMEMAVRLSLGANRRQVLAQLLVESVVLAVMGGLAGLIVARWTLGAIVAMLPPEASAIISMQLSWPVAAFAFALAVATGLIFGMFPALHSTRPDLVTSIRANAGNLSATRGAVRFRTSLVVAQIALSMALLVTAGLFLRSLNNISRVDLGLRTENIITFAVSPELNGYEDARSQQLFERIEEEIAALPGVTSVTAALVPVLAGSNWGTDVRVEGWESGPDIDSNARFNEVGAGFFHTLDIPILAGREFTTSDNAAGASVAIVNEAFARKFNMGSEVVGKWMSADGDSLNTQIIGLVRNAKYSEVKDEVPPLFYMPWRQDEDIGSINFYVRTQIDPSTVMASIPQIVTRLDPNLPIEELKTLPQQVRETVFLDRMIGTMSAAFAGLATLLAAVGLYGVLAYTVTRRTREIGVRMALGANRRAVLLMVLRNVAIMLVIGGIIGIAGAFALGRAASSILFGVEGSDPIVIILASMVLALFALAAGYIPALRASKVDPLRALRYE
jgi:predicted permease